MTATPWFSQVILNDNAVAVLTAFTLAALGTVAPSLAAPVSIFSDLDEGLEADVVARWAEAALAWVARSGCKTPACAGVRARPAQQIRVLAGAAPAGAGAFGGAAPAGAAHAGAAPQPVTVTFLSGAAAFAGASNHGPLDLDAVLVLDPTPGRPFGHPLLVFGVQLNLPLDKCKASHTGVPIGESDLYICASSYLLVGLVLV